MGRCDAGDDEGGLSVNRIKLAFAVAGLFCGLTMLITGELDGGTALAIGFVSFAVCLKWECK